MIDAHGLTLMFWATYFGPDYVEHFGKEFFFNIPAWRVEELDEGILLTVTESFGDFTGDNVNPTLRHLKQTFHSIHPNGRAPVVHGVGCQFYGCRAVEPDPNFNKSMIGLLKRLGVEFYSAAPFPPPIDPNPEQKLGPDGRISGSFLLASHRLLEPANPAWNHRWGHLGNYSSIMPGWFSIGRRLVRDDFPEYEAALNEMAQGRVEFLKLLIPQVKPDFALADDVWDDGVKQEQLEAANLRKLFWVSYFGPHYVEHHGRKFFLNIPAWRIEELEGGFLVIVTETFLEFARHEPKKTLKYLKQNFKSIRPNRFRIHPSF